MKRYEKDFKEDLLNKKKIKFRYYVNKTAKKIKVKSPSIKFHRWDWDGKDERAHIHKDINQICILERELYRMTNEEIIETATHEVEHLRDKKDESNPIHSPEFYDRLDKTKVKNWEPETAGIPNFDGNLKIEFGIKKKIKISKTQCNHHLCENKTKLKECLHCKRFFCEKHLKAQIPNDKFKEGESHPCSNYVDYLGEKEKKKKKKYREALTKLLGSKNEENIIPYRKEDFDFGEYEKKTEKEPIIKKKKKKPIKQVIEENNFEEIENYDEPSNNTKLKDIILPLIILIFLISSSVIIILYPEGIGNLFQYNKCEDKTNYGACSLNQPYYCNQGKLIENASFCGCPELSKQVGQSCRKIPECRDGTLYDTCSVTKPYYCEGGILVEKSYKCGCPEGMKIDKEKCV